MYEKHGLVRTRAYNSWRGMKDRCLNPNHVGHKNYGGRGITICQSWRDSFMDFYRDMGDPPPGTSLERRENSKGYSKENCYWGTRTEQARNKRNNRLITANGVTRTLAEWAEVTGLDHSVILTRIDRDGLTPEEAVTTPSGRPKRTTRWLEHDGLRLSITDWARRLGTTRATLQGRLNSGMTVPDVLTIPIGKINMRQGKKNNRMLTYNGLTLCVADWSDRTGIPSLIIRNRVDAYGWTIERALTTPVISRRPPTS